jgi:hypothetical protein
MGAPPVPGAASAPAQADGYSTPGQTAEPDAAALPAERQDGPDGPDVEADYSEPDDAQ